MGQAPTTLKPPPFIRPLALGALGADVTALKRALIRWNKGQPNGVIVNDEMGAAAVKLLKHFQQTEGLHADGIMGALTYGKLVTLGEFDQYGCSLLDKAAAALVYRNPFRDITNLYFDGYDQGVDFAGSGPVYAVGAGHVTVSIPHGSGWEGLAAISYTLTSGTAAGKAIYLAENVTPHVTAGAAVTNNTIIATLNPSFPHCETGWAQPGTDNPMSQPVAHAPTHFGINFGDLLISLGEHRCAKGWGGRDTPLPPGWPQWLG